MKSKMTMGVESYPALRPVADTVSGTKATQEPTAAIVHYQVLAERLWLPPELEKFASSRLELIAQGRTAWGSIAAPYGFGKTAAGICLWQHGRSSGFWLFRRCRAPTLTSLPRQPVRSPRRRCLH